MNCLIVDALTDGRAEVVVEYLESKGHKVLLHTDQLNAPPGTTLPSPAWVNLVQNWDVVFLHVGEEQRHSTTFFTHALSSLPVFCYTGSEAPPEIAAGCSIPGSQVLCPAVGIGRDKDSGHRLVAVVSRWLECIEGRMEPEHFLDGWHRVRNLDTGKEESLEALEKQLALILEQSQWTPTQSVGEQLRRQLKDLKDQRTEWGI